MILASHSHGLVKGNIELTPLVLLMFDRRNWRIISVCLVKGHARINSSWPSKGHPRITHPHQHGLVKGVLGLTPHDLEKGIPGLTPHDLVKGILGLTHWGREKMDAISQTTFWSAVSWMKMFEFPMKFHWSLFLRVQLTIFQHWFR